MSIDWILLLVQTKYKILSFSHGTVSRAGPVILPPAGRWARAQFGSCLCLVGGTLSSVKPCLYVRFCLPWCVRPCHLLLFIWRCLMGETLPYLALCETLPFETHSFEDVLTYKKQETTAVLILLWESHVMDLPTGFVRTWALDIANSCWIPSKRTDWEVWATVLANCQILKLSCFYVPCHVVIFFHYLPLCFLNSHVFSYF